MPCSPPTSTTNGMSQSWRTNSLWFFFLCVVARIKDDKDPTRELSCGLCLFKMLTRTLTYDPYSLPARKHPFQLVSKETKAQTEASSVQTIDGFSLKDFPWSPFLKGLSKSHSFFPSFLPLPFPSPPLILRPWVFFDLHIFIFLVHSG